MSLYGPIYDQAAREWEEEPEDKEQLDDDWDEPEKEQDFSEGVW